MLDSSDAWQTSIAAGLQSIPGANDERTDNEDTQHCRDAAAATRVYGDYKEPSPCPDYCTRSAKHPIA